MKSNNNLFCGMKHFMFLINQTASELCQFNDFSKNTLQESEGGNCNLRISKCMTSEDHFGKKELKNCLLDTALFSVVFSFYLVYIFIVHTD